MCIRCRLTLQLGVLKGHFLWISGHVIPAEHLLAVALDRGPSGKELDFTYQSRGSTELVKTTGRRKDTSKKMIWFYIQDIFWCRTSLVTVFLPWYCWIAWPTQVKILPRFVRHFVLKLTGSVVINLSSCISCDWKYTVVKFYPITSAGRSGARL